MDILNAARWALSDSNTRPWQVTVAHKTWSQSNDPYRLPRFVRFRN